MLVTNMLIQYMMDQDALIVERVIALDNENDMVVLFDIQDKKALPVIRSLDLLQSEIASGVIDILTEDPYTNSLARPERTIPEKHRQIRDKAYASINELVSERHWELFTRHSRAQAVRDAAEAHKTSGKTIMKRLRRFWRKGMVPNALLPDYANSGAPGKPKPVTEAKRGRRSSLEKAEDQRFGINITEEIAEIIGRSYQRYHVNGKLSLRAAHIKMLRLHFNNGYYLEDNRLRVLLPPAEELPTIHQFRYWGEKSISKRDERRQKLGSREYNLTERMVPTTAKKLSFGPGSVYQIDSTIGDIYLVSQRNPHRIIGRPVIYIIRDHWSKLITGFAVTLDGPSWFGAIQALRTVTQNKVELCSQYGIDIEPWEWPAEHLPQQIIADRGELLSQNALRLASQLHILKSNTPPYRADWKGLVERYFKTINDSLINWLPGAVYEQKRGGRDYRLDAVLNLKQFTKMLILCILSQNNRLIGPYRREAALFQERVEPYPIDLWKWGVENRSGALQTLAQSAVDAVLFPIEQGSISRTGVYFKQIWYSTNDKLEEYRQSHNRGRVAVQIQYDPRLVDEVTVLIAQDPERIGLRDDYEVYSGCTFAEVHDEFELEKQSEQSLRGQRYQKEAHHQEDIDDIIEEAKEASKQFEPPSSKAAKLRNIQHNRRQERIAIHRQQVRSESDVEYLEDDTNPEDTDDVPTYDPTDKIMQYLMENSDG